MSEPSHQREPGPLRGRRVVTTREQPGRLDELLVELGAEVVHVPLIRVGPPADGGTALAAALGRLDRFDWVVVTSRHGADRVGPAVRGAVDRGATVHTAAVGTATAAVLAGHLGRPVDLVPRVQRADALVSAFASQPAGARILVAQADRAEPTLVDELVSLGHHVEAVVAYATSLRSPTADERAAMLAADAVAFASGSAARAWADAVGPATPPVVCVIGPTTERVARAAGLDVTAVADVHSVEGLARTVADSLGGRP